MNKIRVSKLAMIACVSGIAFAITAYLANQPVSTAETSVFDAIFNLPENALPFFRAATYIGTLGVFIALLIVAIRKRSWVRTVLIIPGIALAYGATYFVKEQLVSRARPPELFGITPRDEMDVIARDGFPSGHVAVATLLALWLIFLLPSRWRLWLLAIPVVVGLGRVYVGEHMPLDVLGGMCIGLLVGITMELILRHLQRSRPG